MNLIEDFNPWESLFFIEDYTQMKDYHIFKSEYSFSNQIWNILFFEKGISSWSTYVDVIAIFFLFLYFFAFFVLRDYKELFEWYQSMIKWIDVFSTVCLNGIRSHVFFSDLKFYHMCGICGSVKLLSGILLESEQAYFFCLLSF